MLNYDSSYWIKEKRLLRTSLNTKRSEGIYCIVQIGEDPIGSLLSYRLGLIESGDCLRVNSQGHRPSWKLDKETELDTLAR